MKCHECGQHQSDSNTACGGCGVSFSFGGSEPPKITFYEEESSGLPRNAKIFASLAVLLCLIGAPFVFGGRTAPATVAKVESSNDETARETRFRRREANNLIDEACMESMLQMGSDEVGARANCYNDPEAKKQIQKEQEQDAKIRNVVPAAEISRIELLISDETTGAEREDQPFTLRLRLYDQDGEPASSEGKIEFTFSPEGSIWGGMRSTHIYGNNARIAYIRDDDVYLPIYEFQGYQVQKNQLDGADEIEIAVKFAGTLEATARYSIHYAGE